MAEQQGLSPPGDKKRKAETADHSTSMMTPQRTITTRSQLLQCENALATPPSASTRVGTTPSPKTERQCQATTARKQGAQILEQHVTLHFKGKDFHSVVHVIYGMQFHQMVTKKLKSILSSSVARPITLTSCTQPHFAKKTVISGERGQ